ncbi:MAG: ribonuclease HII [Chitinophagales bacterium]|nr:ribonuclease HII [Chitinophagales bacterium]MCZ2394244.1 ribonuclease HII [Chitinophagales bacterium]
MPEFYRFENKVISGCDEAGRGCLAGPVVAAAVILPDSYFHPILNDSKQVNENDRKILKEDILNHAIAYGIGVVSHTEIDQINILKASFLAMHRAIDQLSVSPEWLIIDGNKFAPYPHIGHQCVVKGDSKYTQIAAASILAKTYRDELMQQLSLEYPFYRWDINKGYPTIAHREAIKKYGHCKYHRMSFRLLKSEDGNRLFDLSE